MVIVSAGLWHMLHVPDPQDFVEQEAAFSRGAALFAAQEQVEGLDASAYASLLHLAPLVAEGTLRGRPRQQRAVRPPETRHAQCASSNGH